MKTETLPSIRVAPEFREACEQALGEGESLSQFVETSVRESLARRRTQAEFVARGLASLQAAKQSGHYVPAEAVLARLGNRLMAANATPAAQAKPPDAATKAVKSRKASAAK